MVIECSSCHTRFKLADDKVKATGTKVRCTKCREVFTVFAENNLPLPPVVFPTVASNTPEANDIDAGAFSFPDESSVARELSLPPPAIPHPEDNEWQPESDSPFSSGFSDDAGASDLDAISFDTFESPVFSVAAEKTDKFELTDDSAFSFVDSSLIDRQEEPETFDSLTDDQPLISAVPSEDLFPTAANVTDAESTFSPAENFADFSWEDAETGPGESQPTEITLDTETTSADNSFDFSSFSFDSAAPADAADDKKNGDLYAGEETTIPLSLEREESPPASPTSPPPVETPVSSLSFLTVKERQESPPPPTRPLRPRSRARQKNSGSTRLAVKVLFGLFLLVTLVYGILNRQQLQSDYKNLVNGYIENQVPVESSGKISLAKLSGGYVTNSQEGDLFVIRGEAVNEFKSLRSSILVRGTIFGENGATLQSQSAYCGNPLKESSLKKSGFKGVREAMSNELGENLLNLNIDPGKGIPCTIVFNKAPKNIKEFTVEVLESKPGSK